MTNEELKKEWERWKKLDRQKYRHDYDKLRKQRKRLRRGKMITLALLDLIDESAKAH